jgi:hypothetical protein
VRFHGHGMLLAGDFPPAFLVVTLISTTSVLIFMKLPHDAGAELANRLPTVEPDHKAV